MPSLANAQLQKTDFLTLLTTQLRYQDPTSPVDQEAFVNQLSQFSMLEGIQELNGSFAQMLRMQEISQGVALVGKTVQYLNPESNQTESGLITRLSVDNGKIYLDIDGQSISMDNVLAVSA